jgi:hypothetical protein
MVRSKRTDAELIRLYVDASPAVGGFAEARLRRSWVPLWALIGHIPVVGNDAEALVDAYEIPVEEAETALAYYRRHRADIDARLEANRVS